MQGRGGDHLSAARYGANPISADLSGGTAVLRHPAGIMATRFARIADAGFASIAADTRLDAVMSPLVGGARGSLTIPQAWPCGRPLCRATDRTTASHAKGHDAAARAMPALMKQSGG